MKSLSDDLGPTGIDDMELVLTVTAGKPAAGSARLAARVHAPLGRVIRFHGCVAGCCPAADLAVDGAAGSVVAYGDHWRLTNESAAVVLRVWNLDNPGDQFRVAPLQSVPVPFDLAGIAGAAGHAVTVLGPPAPLCGEERCVSSLRPAWGLEPTSRRHDVMLRLVGRRLRGDFASALPTAREIGRDLGISHRTVQEHLTWLVKHLAVVDPGHRRPGWIQEALVDFAVSHPYIPRAGVPRAGGAAAGSVRGERLHG